MSTPAAPSTASLGIGGMTVSSRMLKPTPIGPSVSTSWSSQAVRPPSSEGAAARRSMTPTVNGARYALPRRRGVAALPSDGMRQRFTARAAVVGDRAGTVVPDAVLDVADGEIAWLGPAAEAPPADDADVLELPGVLTP